MSRVARNALVAAVTVIFAAGCSEPQGAFPSVGQNWGLASVPSGFEQVGAVELPTDVDAPDYQLDLLESDRVPHEKVGVFLASGVDNCAEGSVTLREDLPGWSGCRGTTQVVVTTRSGDPEDLQSLVDIRAGGDITIPGFTAVAHQDHARVPGLGSLPISFFDTGSVTAYVKSGTGGTDGDQQSIAVGSYRGKASDLAVLQWWFGDEAGTYDGGSRAQFSYPAMTSGDGLPVPTATLVAEVRGDWIVMVRTTDGVEVPADKWLASVTVVTRK